MDIFACKNIKPMLLTLGTPFNREDYIYEFKFDGYRCICYLDKDKVVLKSRNNTDFTKKYPELQDLTDSVNKKCILDGEIVAFGENGPDFAKLQKISRMKNRSDIDNVYFVVFDILYYDQDDLRTMPLRKRKKILEAKVKEQGHLIKVKYIFENGLELYKEAQRLNLEGVVAKDFNSIYESGKRVLYWQKFKFSQVNEFYIWGVKKEQGIIKSVVVFQKKQNDYIYRGKVNVASAEDKEFLNKLVRIYQTKEEKFNIRDVIWVKQPILCEIKYKEITNSGSLRHPVLVKIKS